MKKLSKELRIGVLVVMAIVVLVWGINYLKGSNLFDSSRTFYALYENIGGLQEGSSVSLNGFKIGMVKKIRLLSDKKNSLLVAISIEDNIDIPITEPVIQKRVTGLLPYLSLISPIKGEAVK